MDINDAAILIEETHTLVQVVAEGVIAANERLEQHDRRFDAIEHRLDRVEGRVDLLTDEVRKVRVGQASLERRFDEIASKVDDPKKRLH